MSFGTCWEMVCLIIVVLGGLVIGLFTPTEAGAVGAFGAIVFSLLRKRLNWEKFKKAVVETMKTTGMLCMRHIILRLLSSMPLTCSRPCRRTCWRTRPASLKRRGVSCERTQCRRLAISRGRTSSSRTLRILVMPLGSVRSGGVYTPSLWRAIAVVTRGMSSLKCLPSVGGGHSSHPTSKRPTSPESGEVSG